MKNFDYGSATILVSEAAASVVLRYAAIVAQTGEEPSWTSPPRTTAVSAELPALSSAPDPDDD